MVLGMFLCFRSFRVRNRFGEYRTGGGGGGCCKYQASALGEGGRGLATAHPCRVVENWAQLSTIHAMEGKRPTDSPNGSPHIVSSGGIPADGPDDVV